MKVSAGDWVMVKTGIYDAHRASGFSRWCVAEVKANGEIDLTREHQHFLHTRTISRDRREDWEPCTAPTAWAP